MTRPVRRRTAQDGFALIVVLVGLATITALLAVTAKTGVQHRGTLAAERAALLDRYEAAERAGLALVWLREGRGSPEEARLELEEGTLLLQDAGGLVDLNSALPPLREAALSAVGLPGVDDALVAWRRGGRRVQRPDDLIRVLGLDPARLPRFRRIATVSSGRAGVARDVMTPEASEALRAAGLDAAPGSPLAAPPSGVNFEAFAVREGEPFWIGTVSAGSADGAGRILDLR